MMKIQKLVSVFLACVVISVAFSGCGTLCYNKSDATSGFEKKTVTKGITVEVPTDLKGKKATMAEAAADIKKETDGKDMTTEQQEDKLSEYIIEQIGADNYTCLNYKNFALTAAFALATDPIPSIENYKDLTKELPADEGFTPDGKTFLKESGNGTTKIICSCAIRNTNVGEYDYGYLTLLQNKNGDLVKMFVGYAKSDKENDKKALYVAKSLKFTGEQVTANSKS